MRSRCGGGCHGTRALVPDVYESCTAPVSMSRMAVSVLYVRGGSPPCRNLERGSPAPNRHPCQTQHGRSSCRAQERHLASHHGPDVRGWGSGGALVAPRPQVHGKSYLSFGLFPHTGGRRDPSRPVAHHRQVTAASPLTTEYRRTCSTLNTGWLLRDWTNVQSNLWGAVRGAVLSPPF